MIDSIIDKLMGFDVMAVVIALNFILSGLYAGIDKLQDVIPGDESGVLGFIYKILELLKKIIDFAGMNKAH